MENRIKQIIAHTGLSIRAFAIQCGLNQPTLDRMLKGINAVNLNCIVSICKRFPEVSSEWLLTGEGEMLRQPSRDTERLDKLVDTITILQDALNEKIRTIAILEERIKQLESK